MKTRETDPDSEPIVVRQGSVSVTIYPTVNRIYRTNPATGERELKSAHPQFTLVYYEGTKRRKQKFTDLAKARAEADAKVVKLANGDTEALKLSGVDRFCHTLRHDGVDYGDCIEQLTYLLFLKMADERGTDLSKVQTTSAKGQKEVTNCSWRSLKDKSGTALTDHYAGILRKLREAGGLLADIFAQATPRFNNPVNLKRVIAMIDEEDWSTMDVDVKGAAFEGLLEKAASEGKKGAGQYFTPRPLIQAIVSVT